MHSNRLIREKSPYLLQHAHNPVDWHAWGPEAFEKARSENKPIFLSIGYSTCHWCHVMERESFESEEIAAVLNRSFVPVKVDREERPDVDRIYMMFVQATTGSGGWPMSVFLTPDLKPFYGGTYFPPDNRYGRPGFKYLLEQLANAWERDRERIMQSGREAVEQLHRYTQSGESPSPLDESVLDSAYFQYRRTFDTRYGGFGGAPKFPRPATLNFLLRYFYRTQNQEAADMVAATLRAMAKGGMNDQLGGGFHRYSVDERWFVPHFEKMLYDQAQLAVSYLEAFQVTHDDSLAQTARDILDYVLRDMTHPDGGFFSAEDADSVINPAEPKVKGEGAFYVWAQTELAELLGDQVLPWFAYRYGVETEGNVHEDPHHEFTGRNILFEVHSIDETAQRFGAEPGLVRTTLEEAKSKLLAARSRRVRPHLDDKILTAWNGLMISAFARGALILGEPRYLQAANRATSFVASALYRDGVLLRRFRDGEPAVSGFLDDYAFFAHGLLDLYEASFDAAHFGLAEELTAKMMDLFEDSQQGGFFSTAEGDASLVLRLKEDYDGAEPSGNSIAVLNLVRLGHVTGNTRYRESAQKALQAFMARMHQTPTGVPQLLAALMRHTAPPKQIVLAGRDRSPFLNVLRSRFLPNTSLLGPPVAPGRWPQTEGRTTAYVCENFTCRLPTSEVEKFAELLQ